MNSDYFPDKEEQRQQKAVKFNGSEEFNNFEDEPNTNDTPIEAYRK
jgi:hypothetical protein